jgi:hypothetical protein
VQDQKVGQAKEVKLLDVDGNVKNIDMGYVSAAQRKAVWASKKDGGKGNPNKRSPNKALGVKTIGEKSPMLGKISASCKARAKKKFKVWPSAYASGWGVRCTRGDFKNKK